MFLFVLLALDDAIGLLIFIVVFIGLAWPLLLDRPSNSKKFGKTKQMPNGEDTSSTKSKQMQIHKECPNCHKKGLPKEAEFCPECGTKL